MKKISIFASAIRPNLWGEMFESLYKNNLDFEVVFAGPIDDEEIKRYIKNWPKWFKYIKTKNIKPAQCYEVARRMCEGELINWTADDCVYSENLLDKVYNFWLSLKNNKDIISVKTNEDDKNNDLDDHRFFGFNKNTPLMAPLGFVSRDWIESLGGFDRRYICGQYENDIVMRSIQFGGKVYKFVDSCVNIEHKKKHGESSFWGTKDDPVKWYIHDRTILENSWVVGGYKPTDKVYCMNLLTRHFFTPPTNREVSLVQLDKIELYDSKDIKEKSQSFKGIWE